MLSLVNDRVGPESTNVLADSALDDAAALVRLAEGDERALVSLYRHYGAYVFGLALRILKDRLEAEEVTQDVFSKIWTNAATYRPERGSVLTWVMRIARNRAIDALRSRNASLAHLKRGLESPDGFESWSAQRDPVGEVAMDWERRRVREAVSSLPQEQREALSLAFFSGKTHVEISRVLGEPVGTIKTRIRLAMKKLRAILTENSPSPDDSPKGGAQ
jgi:RNA polymerase sigma-70 factor, ECF subfamily